MLNNYPQTVDLEQGEILVGAYLANRYKHIMNADGGKLYVTSERLIFEPHFLNLDTSVLEIPLVQIMTIEPFLAFVVPKGMKVTTTKHIHKFIVNNRKHIIGEIQHILPR
jgi:hypothetical protein